MHTLHPPPQSPKMDILNVLSQLGVQFKFLSIHSQARHTTAAAAAAAAGGGGPRRSVGGGEVAHPACVLVRVCLSRNGEYKALRGHANANSSFVSPREGK